MDRRQTRGLIALFAVLNIFCWYIFTRPTNLWLAEQGLQSEVPPPADIELTLTWLNPFHPPGVGPPNW